MFGKINVGLPCTLNSNLILGLSFIEVSRIHGSSPCGHQQDSGRSASKNRNDMCVLFF